eukprot:CAMPEP_0168313848 /NCGR_PEP_ID=MMETSP0210-20121227/4808_1 /TAXON_ID=40633 /ORGANISM="Condylostoma magnum, Strain COL2" /LENGTH=46 /DNA_ID= /DNA_START= /DNA_END= /DNA_ORIENTATION=
MEREKLLSIGNLENAFSAFDMDGSGSISADELRAVLGSEIDAPDSV